MALDRPGLFAPGAVSRPGKKKRKKKELLVLRAHVDRASGNGRTAVQMASTSGSQDIRNMIEAHMAAARARPARDDAEDG